MITSEKHLDRAVDPLALLAALKLDQSPYCALLESAEASFRGSQVSILGLSYALRVHATSQEVTLEALNANGQALLASFASDSHRHLDQNKMAIPLAAADYDPCELNSSEAIAPLRALLAYLSSKTDLQADRLYLMGYFAYDLIDSVEELPAPALAESDTLYQFVLPDTLLIADQKSQTARLVSHCFVGVNHDPFSQYEQSISHRSVLPELPKISGTPDYESDMSDADYQKMIETCQEHILLGDVFQIVPSRRYQTHCPEPFLAFRALRQSNPGPYMYFFRFDGESILGSSPESALRYDPNRNQVELMPIAGTRKRKYLHNGEIDHEADVRAELDLRLDSKELAEHTMLVDLARNDLARICQRGSRQVTELMSMVKYARVMHLVSRVEGQLKTGLDALDAYCATMNMGTLVGAPKIEAAKILRQVEPFRRGLYGGGIGYIRADGTLDTAIAIRTARIDKEGQAIVQAGAGIVRDSIAQNEILESKIKATATLSALAMGGAYV